MLYTTTSELHKCGTAALLARNRRMYNQISFQGHAFLMSTLCNFSSVCPYR